MSPAQYRHLDRSVYRLVPTMSASGTQVTGVGAPDVSDVGLLFVGTASLDNRTSLQQSERPSPCGSQGEGRSLTSGQEATSWRSTYCMMPPLR
ncbi:hypothetical protein AAH978_18575 [Streptomyces sp. ZYX-F-203]